MMWGQLKLVTGYRTILDRQAGTPGGMVFEQRLQSQRELPRQRSGDSQAEGRQHESHKARMSLRLEEEGQCGWSTARGKCMRGGWRGEQRQLAGSLKTVYGRMAVPQRFMLPFPECRVVSGKRLPARDYNSQPTLLLGGAKWSILINEIWALECGHSSATGVKK